MGETHLAPEAMARLLNEELTPAESATGEAHLRVCADCRAKLDDLTATMPTVAAVLRPATPRPAAPDAPPGFELLEPLSLGKTAAVYRARQPPLGRIVALKVLSGGWPSEEEAQRRFQAEIEAASRQNHPGIVQVFEVGSHEGRPFLVMEYCPGGSLAERLRGGPLPPRDAAALIESLARSLDVIHAGGFIHRDLKPGNILFDGGGRPKIADFGVVKRLDAANTPTPVGSVLGTPPYLAPEQIDGSSRIGPASDLYALGAILYECFTGRPPFRAEAIADTLFDVLTREPLSPRLYDPRLPRDLETICLKCLQKEPARRYGAALALADDLQRFLDGRPVMARRVGVLGRARRWGRRNPLSATLAAVLALTVFVGLALCGWLWYQAIEKAREAETARHEAEVNFLRMRRLLPDLVEAGNGPWQQVAERRRLRRVSLERARDLYRELCQTRPDDRALHGEFAEVLTNLTEVALSEERPEAAVEIARQALALWTALTDEAPAEPRWRSRRADALSYLATAHQQLGRPAEMMAVMREALAIYQKLSDEAPEEARRLLAACRTRAILANRCIEVGRANSAQTLFADNRRRLGDFVARDPNSPEIRLVLVQALWRLGQHHEWRGDRTSAIRCWRQGCELSEGLMDALPKEPQAWFYPIVCARGLPRGEPLALTPAQALPRLEQTIRFLEASFAFDPEAAETAAFLIEAGRALADCYLDAGQAADALRAERRANEVSLARPLHSPVVELERLEGLARVARRERQAGQIETARRHAHNIADDFEVFCRLHRTDPLLMTAALDRFPSLAAPLRHVGATDQSRRIVELALRIAREGEKANADAAHWRQLSEVWTQMAKCRMRDEPAGVEIALRESVDAARRLVILGAEHRSILDERLRRFARFLSGNGRRREAADCLRERQRLWPDDADGLRGVARDFHELAEEVKSGRPALSLAEKDERQGYLAESMRLEKAADALGR